MDLYNNWDCPGYNILLSHSDGGGFFKYLTEDGSIETMNDPTAVHVYYPEGGYMDRYPRQGYVGNDDRGY